MNDSDGCLLAILVVVAAIAFAIWGRHTELRYRVQYSTDGDQVVIERKPKDCNFLYAPLGLKDCRYEKEVVVVKYGLDAKASRPVVSYDNGKTWNWNDGGPIEGASVYVSWRKETP